MRICLWVFLLSTRWEHRDKLSEPFSFCYEDSIPPHRHIARIFGDCVGIEVDDVRPSCAVDATKLEYWRGVWSGRPRPVVVCNRQAGPYTPNKDWPLSHWAEFLSRLSGSCTLVEIGKPDPFAFQPPGPHYIDLRGKTALSDLTAVIASCDLHVGPISGPFILPLLLVSLR